MIGISRLYCGTAESSDSLRYGRVSSAPAPGASGRAPDMPAPTVPARKPVVVWNSTRRCNLACVHCYARATSAAEPGEMTTEDARALIEDLARFNVPVILFSGGEPLLRPDLFGLAAYAVKLGLRAVVSTNGTLIDRAAAERLRDCGVSYVGVSIDGLEKTNDSFRGSRGAFAAAMSGVRNCLASGVKVGLRFTMTRANVHDIPGVFDLVRSEGIPRACFYHLVYAGRGASIASYDLDHAAARRAIDLIIDRTAALHAAGAKTEVLTVDNHADGPYLYLRMLREKSPTAAGVLELLRSQGGGSSGAGIGCVSWDGTVHPDQFWRHATLGNVRHRPFSEIWSDAREPLLARLRQRPPHLAGRCARCRFLEICGGGSRVRAEAATGDPWASDPACYLTDAEIGLDRAPHDGPRESVTNV